MKNRWLPRVLFTSLFALVACGGGSGGCGGCSSLTPIPGGFPQDKRIDNAANIRITESGFAFLKDNIGTLAGGAIGASNGLSIPIPATQSAVPVVGNIDICQNVDPAVDPSYECKANIDVPGLHLDSLQTAQPNIIALSGTIPIQVESLPLNVPLLGGLRVFFDPGNATECTDIHHDFVNVPIAAQIAIERVEDPSVPSRNGLSRIKVVSLDPQIDDSTIHIVDRVQSDSAVACFLFGGAPCCPKGFITDSNLLSFIKGLLIGQFTGPLTAQIENALCTKPTVDAPCPTGTHEDGGKCLFDDDATQCASTVIGLDGSLNVGGLLASVSPTTKGALDIQFAAGGKSNDPVETSFKLGDLYPKNNGATLAMSGGAEAHPDPNMPLCGPVAQVPLPTNVPTPIELFGNDGPTAWDPAPTGENGGPPHVGIGISEKFLNYALASVYNSGALCLQVDSSLNDLLSTSTFAFLIPSLKALQAQTESDSKANAPVGIVINPSIPPVAKIGKGIAGDPTLAIALNSVALDFYVFSMDRYVRVFTLKTDISVPVNLEVGADGGLTPAISDISLTNTSLDNYDLIQEDPQAVADGIKSVIGSAVGGLLGGAIPAINLNSQLASLGVSLIIPPTKTDADGNSLGSPGVTRIPFDDASVNDNNRYLGIFARLCVSGSAECPTAPTPPPSLSHAKLVNKIVSPAGLVVTTMTNENRPVVEVEFSSELESLGKVEYAYRIDGGFWHPFVQSKVVDIGASFPKIQGVHDVEVRSRLVGKGYSPDLVPSHLEVRFDVEAPQVKTTHESGVVRVVARDSVSKSADLRGRITVNGEARTDWMDVAELPAITKDLGDDYNVEVKDEEGNIGTLREELRGRVDNTNKPASSGGCGCTVPGSEGSKGPGSLGLLGIAAALGMVASRWSARRKRLAEAAAGVAVMSIAGSWAGCSCSGDDKTPGQQTAGTAGTGGTAGAGGASYKCDPDQGCITLEPGLVGAYTSADVASDGAIWVAGYNDSAYNKDNGDYEYGDLVVGKYDPSADKVAWKTVDGLPDGDPDGSLYDLNGWRPGYGDPGPNVGLWTSLRVGTGDVPMVAYHDRTNKKLKFASLSGDAWSIHDVDSKADSVIGEYAKMLVIDGKPVIVYLSRELQDDGSVTSKIKIARGNSATPKASGDWTLEEDAALTFATGGCDLSLCKTGTKCSKVSRKCQETLDTCTDCSGVTKACLADPTSGEATCTAILGTTSPIAYPDANGLYLSAAKDGTDVGFVYYDRVRGDLWAARKVNGAWATTLLDGQASDLDTGDVGIGASLFIDGADWHISYVDGITESVKYMKWSGAEAGTVEVVDNGSSLDPADPVHHIVGDDSSILVANGVITVAYQDATAGTLRVATRDAAGTWTPKVVTQTDKTGGFFSIQLPTGGKIGNFFRKTEPTKISGDVSFVAP